MHHFYLIPFLVIIIIRSSLQILCFKKESIIYIFISLIQFKSRQQVTKMPIITSQTQLKDIRHIAALQQKIKLFIQADSKILHKNLLEQIIDDILVANCNALSQPYLFVEKLKDMVNELNLVVQLEEMKEICKKIVIAVCIKIIEIFANRVRKSQILQTITGILRKSLIVNIKQQKKSSPQKWRNQPKYTPNSWYPQLTAMIVKQIQVHIKVVWNLQLDQMIDLVDFINELTASAQHDNPSKSLIQNMASEINAFFKSGRQDLVKYADKNNIQKLRQLMSRKMKKQKVFDRINLQKGLNLSYTLMTSQFQSNKIIGFKLLDQFTWQYSYFTNEQKCDMFASWLANHGIFQMIVTKQINNQMLQHAEYLFKVFQNVYTNQKAKIQYLISLLKTKPQNPKIISFLTKEIGLYSLSIQSKQLIFNYFDSLTDYSDFNKSYFQILTNMTSKYDENILNQKVFYLFCKIMQQCYDKWSQIIKLSADITMQQIVHCYYCNYKGKSNEVKINAIKDLVIFLFKKIDNVNIIIFKLTFIKEKFGNLLSNNPLQLIFSEIIPKQLILERIFTFLKQNQSKNIDQIQFMQVIKYLTSKTVQKQDFIMNNIQILSTYPQIYKEILSSAGYSQMQALLNRIYDFFRDGKMKIEFKVLKLAFQKFNYSIFTENTKEYSLYQYQQENKTLRQSPKNLKLYPKLIDLMVQTKDVQLKEQLSRYIVSLFINYKGFKKQNSQEALIQFLTQTINDFQVNYEEMKNRIQQVNLQGDVLVDLLLIEKCLEFTDILGCGDYMPHKSLVATSSIYMVILNNITFGDDVAKVVQHDFPSNMILFDVLTFIGLAFKCGPEQIILHQGQRLIHPIHNSRCLEDLHLNNLQIIAERNLANRIQIPSIQGTTGKQMNPIIIKAVKQVFFRFAYQGKMSLIQCTNFIKHSTGSECLSNDRRVREIMQQSDRDNDGIINVDDFVYYHHKNFARYPYTFRQQLLKSFFNLRYHKNFTLYHVPIDLSHKYYLMMRYKILKQKKIYNYLFQLSESSNLIFSSKAKQLLLLLPSYHSQQNFINSPLNFAKMSQFTIYYKLISILNSLSVQNNTNVEERMRNIDRFSENKNNEIIFGLIQEYNVKTVKSQYDEKCFLICLKILRSLINVQYLSKLDLESFRGKDLLIPNIPATTFFNEQAKKALQSRNILNFQTLLVLQLTQHHINIEQIAQYCFHPQEQIRKISSAFLFILSTIRQTSLNLFTKPIPENNNQQWFNLLCGIISNNIISNNEQLQKEALFMLSKRKEDTSNNYDNLMNGYLRILQKLLTKNAIHKGQIQVILKNLLENTLSQKNRAIIYEIIIKINIDISLSYFNDMLTHIYPSNQCQIRQRYSGIKNLGCICYINSILQQLFTIDRFRHMILTKNVPKDCQTVQVNGKEIIDDFMYQLQKLYHYLQYSHKKYYIPQQFCYAKKDLEGKPINVAIQEDSHQFLNNLIQKSQEAFKKQNTLSNFQQIFLIKTLVEIECEICKNKISRIENNYNLMIQVKDQASVFDSLKKYTAQESISDYFCEKCDKKVKKISKNTYLNHLPQVMTLNLQRIVYDKYKNQRIKVHSKLTFPNQLNFQQFIKNDEMSHENVYNLKGVVIHSGNSQGGHYYSLIKTQKYGWLKFNDQTVTPFDQKQIQRECFGGVDNSKDYIDVNYSSSAYILFYEKKNVVRQIQTIQIQNQFTLQIQNQNTKLLKQLQIHQSSFFYAIINAYQHIKVSNLDEKMAKGLFYDGFLMIQPERKEKLRKMKQIIQRALSFLTVFTDIKSQVKIRIGVIMTQLLFCLPEDNVAYLKELNIQTYIQNMITLQDPNYRQALSTILYFSVINFISFTNFSFKNIPQEHYFFVQKLDIVMDTLQSKIMYLNMSKLDGYFNFCKKLLNYDRINFMQYMNDRGYFFKLLDMIYGKDSIYHKYHNYAHNLPVSLIQNISSHLELFLQRKTNCLQQRQKMNNSSFGIIQTTNEEQTIILNAYFYKRLFKMGYVNQSFIKFIDFYSFNDESYTIMVMEIYLTYLNKRETIQKISIFVEGLKSFLKLNDNVKRLRFSSILGFPQVRQIEEQFCFERCTNEQIVHYTSGLKYKKRSDLIMDKRPLLQILYDASKSSPKSLEILQFLEMILQLSCQDEDVYNYIISLPAPNYFMKHYFEWIPQVITRISNTKDFYLENKTQKIQILRVYYALIQSKILKEEQLPNQKYIIGRTESQSVRDQQKNQIYSMTLTLYSTFILQNQPYGHEQNKSLPRKQFPFYSSLQQLKTQDKANAFIKPFKFSKYANTKSIAKDLTSKHTIYTLKGQLFVPLILQFAIEGFKYIILIDEGKFDLNFPFREEGKIEDHVLVRRFKQTKVQDCGEEVMKIFKVEKQKQKEVSLIQQQKVDGSGKQQVNPNLQDKFICESCTFINEITNEYCQMCLKALF